MFKDFDLLRKVFNAVHTTFFLFFILAKTFQQCFLFVLNPKKKATTSLYTSIAKNTE